MRLKWSDVTPKPLWLNRRQLIAGRDVLLPDSLFQLLGDLFVELAAANQGH